MARTKETQALKRLAGVLQGAAKEVTASLAPAIVDNRHGNAAGRGVIGDGLVSRVIQSGQAERVVFLKLSCWPHAQIARDIGLSDDVVDRYVKSPHYAKLYEEKKAVFLGMVLEAMQSRFLEVGLEAVEIRLDLMRNAKNRWLRDKIAKDFIELAMEIGKAKGPAGGVVEKLAAVVERIRRRRLKDGTEIVEKVKFTGPAGEAATQLAEEVSRAAAGADEPEAGGEGTGDYPGTGEVDGAGGAGEGESGVGGARSDRGDGAGGVRASDAGERNAG